MKSLLPKLTVLWMVVAILGCATKFEPANPEAFGTRWELLGIESTNKNQIFYDPQSVTHSGSITKFKVRSALAGGDEAIGWVEFDCEKDMWRGSDLDLYDKYNRFVKRIPDQTWVGIDKGSILDQNRWRFCK
jgi:hypothetical protein